jgi:hypothetical protein
VHPGLSGGREEVQVNSADPAMAPNGGLEMNVTAYNPPELPPTSSFQVSAVDVVGGDQAVFGIFENTTIPPIAFYAVFSNSTHRELWLQYWYNLPLVPGEGYDFALQYASGGNWSFTVDGVPFDDNATLATYDFGSSVATWGGGESFTELALYAGDPYAPPTVSVPLAMATWTAGAWRLPTSGYATSDGSLPFQWGMAGHLQRTELAPGEILSGPYVATAPTNLSLWDTGPIPVSVAVSVSPRQAVAGTGVSISATVSLAGYGPLAGVPVTTRDMGGGLVSPEQAVTGTEGNATQLLLAPNVSLAGEDSVLSMVALLGFNGSGNTTVYVTPAAQVTVQGPGTLTVLPNGVATVSFHVEDLAGHAVVGVPVSFTVNGTAGLDPPLVYSDAAGEASTTVQVPGSVGVFTLTASVLSGGYWGSARVTVRVQARTAAPAPVWPVYVALAIVAGLLVALGAILLRAPRRPTTPLPSLGDLRRHPRRPPPAGPGAPPIPPVQP